jgi:hypothetical protein
MTTGESGVPWVGWGGGVFEAMVGRWGIGEELEG